MAVNAKTLIEGSNRNYQLPSIEKGVPIPLDALSFDKRYGRRTPWPEFLHSLEEGDSFVVPWSTTQHLKTVCAYMGIPLVYRELDSRAPNGVTHVRIWRIG